MYNISRYLLLVALLLQGSAWAQENVSLESVEPKKSTTFQQIKQLSMKSNILNRQLKLQVYLPNDYEKSQQDYSVLYLLDGQYYFHYGIAYQQTSRWRHKSPEFIVVAIDSSDKLQRNLDFGTDSGLANYREFIEKELLDFVDNQYRTSGDRILFGWQSPGYLVTQLLLQRPELFNGYIVASGASSDPETIKSFAGLSLVDEKFLYFAHSPSETWSAKRFGNFIDGLQSSAPKHLRWKSELFDDEDHWSTPHLTINKGLTEYFKGYKPIRFNDLTEFNDFGGYQAVVNYYRLRAEKYSVASDVHYITIFNLLLKSMREGNYQKFDFFMQQFTGEVSGLYPAVWQNKYGQFYLQHKKLAKAKDVYDKAIVLLPNSPLMHMGLGDVYRAQKQNSQAQKSYERAIKLAKTMGDPAISEFSETLKEFKETL